MLVTMWVYWLSEDNETFFTIILAVLYFIVPLVGLWAIKSIRERMAFVKEHPHARAPEHLRGTPEGKHRNLAQELPNMGNAIGVAMTLDANEDNRGLNIFEQAATTNPLYT